MYPSFFGVDVFCFSRTAEAETKDLLQHAVCLLLQPTKEDILYTSHSTAAETDMHVTQAEGGFAAAFYHRYQLKL